MTRTRRFLRLMAEERKCVLPLFCILAIALPGFYGTWHFVTTDFERSASFAFVLGLRLIVPVITSGVCGLMLWKHRSLLTASSVGAAFVYTGILFAFFAAWILVFGRMPSKYHPYAVPREQSVPFFIAASVALTIGVSARALAVVQKPNKSLERSVKGCAPRAR